MSITINGNPGESEVVLNGNPGESDMVVASLPIADAGFVLEETVVQEVISGSASGQITVNDAVLDQQTGALVETRSHLDASGNEAFTFESLDTSIATVTPGGQTAWVANGTARILVKGTHLWKRKNVAVDRTGGQSVNSFSHYATGSLAKLLTDNIDNAIAGKTFATNGLLFASMDHVTPAYVRNTQSWPYLAGIDCTGISCWNSDRLGIQAQWNHGTVLHPRIAIMAAHYVPQFHIGATVRFVTNDNVVVDRVVDAVLHVTNGAIYNDIYLVRFDVALPGTINVVQVLPSDWQDYLPSIPTNGNVGYRIPGLATDQLKAAYVYDLRYLRVNAGWDVPEDATRQLFVKTGGFVGGDSGSPKCLVAGTQLIMVSSASSTTLPNANNLTLLDAGMDTLVSGAASTKFDVSGFTAY